MCIRDRSLFPPTYNNRENGLRPEFVELLKDMKPKFFVSQAVVLWKATGLPTGFNGKKQLEKLRNVRDILTYGDTVHLMVWDFMSFWNFVKMLTLRVYM